MAGDPTAYPHHAIWEQRAAWEMPQMPGMVEQPDHNTTRPILTPSIPILSRSTRVNIETGGECLGTVTWGSRRAEGRLGSSWHYSRAAASNTR
jgi:hypothetical protein